MIKWDEDCKHHNLKNLTTKPMVTLSMLKGTVAKQVIACFNAYWAYDKRPTPDHESKLLIEYEKTSTIINEFDQYLTMGRLHGPRKRD